MANVYLVEVYRLADDVVTELDLATAIVETPAVGTGLITVNHAVHSHIASALNSAARLRTLCVDRGQGPGQSALAHKIQLRRASWLRGLLSGIDLDPLGEAKVRNTLEHFDEYVDETAIAAANGEMQLPALVPVDFVLSQRDLLEQFHVDGVTPSVVHVRVFLSDENRYVNCGHEVDLGPIRRVSSGIIERLAPMLPKELSERDVRGSSMVVLKSESFL